MDQLRARLRFWRDHRWAPDRMSDYIDGELPAGADRRMKRHLDECAECRGLAGGLRALVTALHRLPAPPGVGAAQIAAGVRMRLGEPA